MAGKKSTQILRSYFRELEKVHATGKATEHSYRPALQELIHSIGGQGVRAINDPTHVDCGAPDFTVERQGVPIGYIECKDVPIDLDRTESDEQLDRYRKSLPNLILTNYLEFRWYVLGELRHKAQLAHFEGKSGIKINKKDIAWVVTLLNFFLEADLLTISSPSELAERMASKARLLRECIKRILEQKEKPSSLHELLDAYRSVLIKDLSPEQFADLQAQTAAYGLFAARCQHEPQAGPFNRQSAVFAKTTPFLQDVFGRIAGPGIDSRIAWIVDDLALLLDRANMKEILTDFGSGTSQNDPVVHFYEDFLAAYDPKLREERGVYYTPEPVVSYIVKSVDYLLRDRFGLSDGLADTTTNDNNPKVLILDPAAGTGTFLLEVVKCIHTTIENRNLGGAWPDYVRSHLLGRLFGFELLMASYAICHLKLALEIGGTDNRFQMPEGQRLNVFLTNALEEVGRSPTGMSPLFGHEIFHEAAGADVVKREKPVMVVIGNPPYSGHSANKGKWIKRLLRGWDGNRETDNYFMVDGKPLGERNSKWLNDDYVKFIRFAQWKIDQTDEGILGYVTNHSYLENSTFSGMRQSLMRTFSEIYLLDLHGNKKKKEKAPDGSKDENVFAIQQGVAIGLFIKRANADDTPARVFHADLWGRREKGPDGGKYGWLAANDFESTKWEELSPKSPLYLFTPRDNELAEEYEKGWKLTDIFPVNSVGIVTARDKLTIQWTAEEVRHLVSDFKKLPDEEARNRYNLPPDVRDWKVSWAQKDLQEHPEIETHLSSILYRPFDTRFTYYTGRSRGFICMPRWEIMRHMLYERNVGLCVGRSGQVTGSKVWDVVFVSKYPSDFNLFRRGGNNLFPLYIYAKKNDAGVCQANLSQKFVEEVGFTTGLEFISDGAGDFEATFGPEDVFHYIYALLHSPEYRRRYADFLKSDFPYIQLTDNRKLFADLAALGKRLVSLHLMEVEAASEVAFPLVGPNRVDNVRYTSPTEGDKGRVWINPKQYFEGVTPGVWSFCIGGYRPVERWLKDRKDRDLSFDDVSFYCKICAVLSETSQIMSQIDDIIRDNGGWPLN
ncbi:MAG: N-6 DNA methylase [Candidatus Dadabacteria bacterium]|nr:N-6 DNA methylase [Candidatus Dadabacteria bacterium]